ncbi:MAG: SNF2-related protein [Candidatus Latescibacterota bacterium]
MPSTPTSATSAPQPGDAWEWVLRPDGQNRIPLDGALGGLLASLDGPLLLGVGPDYPVPVECDGGALRGEGIGTRAGSGAARLECLARSPWTFVLRPVAEEVVLPAAVPEVGVPVRVADDARVLGQALSRPPALYHDFQVSLQAGRLSTVAGFDQLLCLPLLRDVEQLEHQTRTVLTVLRRFRGHALLCDEVGLGKTVEAGMVLLELVVRGLVHRVLVLTPPALMEQWQGEMLRKLGLDFVAHDAPAFRERGTEAWGAFPRVIASYHTAKRQEHREHVQAQEWDLVIVDEAHHLRNRRTLLWQLVSRLHKKYILLLTATPVQNDLEELFSLVTLLDPGLLGTERDFLRQFVDRRDRMLPRNVDGLHRLLGEVMVRNRRATIGCQFTRRIARTDRVPLGPAEQHLYREVSGFVRQQLRRRQEGGAGLSRMALLTVQKELGSSPQAAAPTLARLAAGDGLAQAESRRLGDLALAAEALEDNAKLAQLQVLLGEFAEPMVVFTQFRATHALVARRLMEAGIHVVPFHGGLSRLDKEAAVARFRREGGVLLCTETGSEGRNLQFCHAVCNFDLPWNPMRIEQRIGRLSRIGQSRDVYVFNLAAAGTVEDAVLHLLEAKINMFELVVGEIDMILGNWEEDQEFEEVVADLWSDAQDEAEFRRRMEELGDRLRQAREAYVAQRQYDDRFFGDVFQP